MALTESQKRKMDMMLNRMSAAELDSTLQSMNNMRGYLYNEHYEFYLQVKDKLNDVWDYAKSVAVTILKGLGYIAAGAAVGVAYVAAAPFMIVGGILKGIFGD